MAMAKPWKIGSKTMTKLPTTTAAAVRSMGRKRTAPASMIASSSAIPSLLFISAKSMRMMELRTMMPARAMNPIMDVAVKKAPNAACPGRMPMRVRGIGAMITTGVVKSRNQATTRM